MKKYLLKVALFFALIAVIDIASVYVFRFLTTRAKYGETYKNNYIANISKDDVIILGSSHAARHYVPSVLQDSLGLSCYNCGEPGCGIIPAYARYKMIAERKKPLLVIYEATPGYDYFVSDDYSKYLGRIRQYSDNNTVAEMYETLGDELEPLRLMSGLYRNNSKIAQNIMDLVVPSKDNRGYDPLYGKLTKEAVENRKETQVERDIKSREIDSLKLTYVERLFADAKNDNVSIICFVSPSFTPRVVDRNNDYLPIIELCKKYNVPYVDNNNYEGITGEMELFQDFGHLNDKGAKKYTASIIPIIRDFIKK